jgi:hypothetical protein
MNKYEEKVIQIIEKNKGIDYSPMGSNVNNLSLFGEIDFKEEDSSSNYIIALRNCRGENDNLYIHDILIRGKFNKKSLRGIIKLNEIIAKEFGCSSISVEESDNETKKGYIEQGYLFEKRNSIGVKELKWLT